MLKFVLIAVVVFFALRGCTVTYSNNTCTLIMGQSGNSYTCE